MGELKKILSYPANDIDKILQQGVYSVDTEEDRESLVLTIKTINRTVYVRDTKKMYVWNGTSWEDVTPGGNAKAILGNEPPTNTTVAEYEGQFYLDVVNENTYQCTAITAQGTNPETYLYTWVKLLRESDLENKVVMTIHRADVIQLMAYATPQAGVTYVAVNDLSNYGLEYINEISKAISNCADITNTTQTVYLSDESSISIGATVSYALSTQETVTDRILGFNHDNLTNPLAYGEATATGKAGITWQNVDCLATRYPMNDTNTNAGGYPASLMKTSTLPTIKATLPQNLQDIIKTVDKKSANGGSSNYSETVTTSENLFLLAGVEIFGSDSSYGYAQDGANEGTQYAYWSAHNTANDRIKYYDNAGTLSATGWWERSSNYSITSYFCTVNNIGGASYYSASSSRGVAFAYCT